MSRTRGGVPRGGVPLAVGVAGERTFWLARSGVRRRPSETPSIASARIETSATRMSRPPTWAEATASRLPTSPSPTCQAWAKAELGRHQKVSMSASPAPAASSSSRSQPAARRSVSEPPARRSYAARPRTVSTAPIGRGMIASPPATPRRSEHCGRTHGMTADQERALLTVAEAAAACRRGRAPAAVRNERPGSAHEEHSDGPRVRGGCLGRAGDRSRARGASPGRRHPWGGGRGDRGVSRWRCRRNPMDRRPARRDDQLSVWHPRVRGQRRL